ncbi:hypothetical protein OC845_005992 [Tilletia horrida]|nr:hypothetical protein OC845_005992 [Tilletia horrida]
MQSPPAMPPSYEDFNYTAEIDPNDPFFSSILASPPNVSLSPYHPAFHIGVGTPSGTSAALASLSSINHFASMPSMGGPGGLGTAGQDSSATLLSSPILPSPFPFGGVSGLPGTSQHDQHQHQHHHLDQHLHHHHQQQQQQQEQHHQPPPPPLTNSLFDASEQSFLLSFLSGFDGEFNPSLPDNLPSFADAAARVAAQGPPHPISPPHLSSRPPPKPSRTMSTSSSSLTLTASNSGAGGAADEVSLVRRTSGHAGPGATGGVGSSRRELLTDSEKRQNHILSEQRRRNYIREGFKELVELLDLGRAAGAMGLGLGAAKGTGVEEELWAAAIANGTAGEAAYEEDDRRHGVVPNGRAAGANGLHNGARGDEDGDGLGGVAEEEDEEDEGQEEEDDDDQGGPRKRVATGSSSSAAAAASTTNDDRPRSRAGATRKDGTKLARSRSGTRKPSANAAANHVHIGKNGSKAGGGVQTLPLPLGSAGGKGKGRGRGGSAGGGAGSKSAVLFQAVDLIRWLSARNEDLESQCNALESFRAARVAQINPHLLAHLQQSHHRQAGQSQQQQGGGGGGGPGAGQGVKTEETVGFGRS